MSRESGASVSAEEHALLEQADGLYERLKAEKALEKKFWLSKWWHQVIATEDPRWPLRTSGCL